MSPEDGMDSGWSGGEDSGLDESYIRALEAELWTKSVKVGQEAGQEMDWPFPSWDRYQFQAFLGQGAMGQVFRVFDPVLNRPVALKVLNERAMNHAHRFLDEARAQARVEHRNVAKVHEVGEVEGRPYLVMQLLHGQSLQVVRGHLSMKETVEVLRQACDGVQAAHSMGLLHRDLKPGNIVVEKVGEGRIHAFVVDFGMAVCVDADQVGETPLEPEIMGTPAFMSPEQAAGRGLDRRSDVFALGTTLYFALTGHSPFVGEGILSILGKVAVQRVPSPASLNPEIPRDLAAIVNRAMEKEPSLRYPSARALGMDLNRWLQGDVVEAMGRYPLYRAGRWIRKNRLLSIVCVLLGMTLVGALIWGGHARYRSRMQAAYYQQFGQDAERMEAAMSLSEAMELHDTLPDRLAIREQMRCIEQTIAVKGSVAEAPGLYALGRGYLVLGEWKEARAALERAWQIGMKTPETGFSLGFCLSRVYQGELEGLSGASRAERKAELDRTLKPLIETCLARARQGTQAVLLAFSEALLAKAEGRLEEAIAKADQVLVIQPWRVDALILKAECFQDQPKGVAQKRASLGKAIQVLEQAANIARSSATVYECLAKARLEDLKMAINARTRFSPYMERCMDAVSKARQAHSRSWSSHWVEGNAWFALVSPENDWYWKDEKERDFAATMARVISCFDKASAVEADALLLSRDRADAWWSLGMWQSGSGQDPRFSLEKAIDSFKKGMISPRYFKYSLGGLGTCYALLGEWEMQQGRDPWALYGKALDYYERFLAIKPEYALYSNCAALRRNMARFQRWQGKESRDFLLAALRSFEESLKLYERQSPAMLAETYLQLADIHLQMVENSAWQGKADMEALRAARAHIEQAVSVMPEDVITLKCKVRLALLESFLGTGRADLKTAKADLEKLLRRSPSDSETWYFSAWLALEAFRGQASPRAFAELEKRIEVAMGFSNPMPELHFLAYDACRLAMKKGVVPMKSASWRSVMLEHMERCRRMNPLVGPEVDRLLRLVEADG